MSKQEPIKKEPLFRAVRARHIEDGAPRTVFDLQEGRELPAGEVGCKICNKSIHQIFVEHIEDHLHSEDED